MHFLYKIFLSLYSNLRARSTFPLRNHSYQFTILLVFFAKGGFFSELWSQLSALLWRFQFFAFVDKKLAHLAEKLINLFIFLFYLCLVGFADLFEFWYCHDSFTHLFGCNKDASLIGLLQSAFLWVLLTANDFLVIWDLILG